MQMKMKAPRGTTDLLPEHTATWQYIEHLLKDLSEIYNYKEIRTPLFEHTEVFQRGVGDTTDIVQKEMYEFTDRGGRSITLRPEGTAPVVRAYNEHKMYGDAIQPTKWYYFAEMYRYERPQQGRMRQFHQFGVEVLGSEDPSVDAEVIALAMTAYEKLGLKNIKLVLNSLGDADSRQAHRDALISHFTPHVGELCTDCQNRLENNPLRILDCKKDREHPAMQTAPETLDFLNDASKVYFEKVKTYLDVMNIPYEVDPTLVRGLDYYNHTAFEIMSGAKGFGAITTLLGGGRYNGLTEQLGGPASPGIGFGMGLERLIMALEAEQITLPIDDSLDVYIVSLGDKAQLATIKLMQKLRDDGLKVDKDYMGKKMKAQFKNADRLKADFVVIIGDDEIDKGSVQVRTMATGDQEEININEVNTRLSQLVEEKQS